MPVIRQGFIRSGIEHGILMKPPLLICIALEEGIYKDMDAVARCKLVVIHQFVFFQLITV
ncbi:hypothetical protein MTBBW1_3120001 [Desulfamplus magnetovallimortis]|uniref:Uncharacterized protein n=1 Tax=Desulfamplus magnetovallimortis TaxID=1246637 RepID=A0A1W1HGA5_9BACT|nr:hypothetical protein MTBBW1_3120001 [Desulfamplus magnetovallimortis]